MRKQSGGTCLILAPPKDPDAEWKGCLMTMASAPLGQATQHSMASCSQRLATCFHLRWQPRHEEGPVPILASVSCEDALLPCVVGFLCTLLGRMISDFTLHWMLMCGVRITSFMITLPASAPLTQPCHWEHVYVGAQRSWFENTH